MYHIRSASLACLTEGLITTPQLEAAYADTQLNTNPNCTQELWRSILALKFPNEGPNDSNATFTISSVTDHSEIRAGDNLLIVVSLATPPMQANRDPRVLLTMGLQGKDRDTSTERELLVVRFVAWAKKEVKRESGIRFLFGLLVVGTYGRLLKYDKVEGILKPLHDDEWLDARNDKWKGKMEDVKKMILEAAAM